MQEERESRLSRHSFQYVAIYFSCDSPPGGERDSTRSRLRSSTPASPPPIQRAGRVRPVIHRASALSPSRAADVDAGKLDILFTAFRRDLNHLARIRAGGDAFEAIQCG